MISFQNKTLFSNAAIAETSALSSGFLNPAQGRNNGFSS